MFCHAHHDRAPVARCTRCGVLVCGDCRERRWGRAVCRACVAPRPAPAAAPVAPAPLPIPPAVPAVAVPLAPPRPGRRPSARAAGVLGVIPGLGHVYAGSWLRGLVLLALAPVAFRSMAHGGMPVPLYAFLHGLVAFDGYRLARKRRGEWTRADAREARGVWAATAGALLLLGLSGAGVALSPWLAAAVLIPLGVGLMLGGRETPAGATVAPAPGSPVAAAAAAHPLSPAQPAAAAAPGPGTTIDRRADRAALAAALAS